MKDMIPNPLENPNRRKLDAFLEGDPAEQAGVELQAFLEDAKEEEPTVPRGPFTTGEIFDAVERAKDPTFHFLADANTLDGALKSLVRRGILGFDDGTETFYVKASS